MKKNKRLSIGKLIILMSLLIIFVFLFSFNKTLAVEIGNYGATLGLATVDLVETVVNVIQWVLGLLGLVAVIIIIYGGFVWMTAAGNEEKIQKAKKILIRAVIGLAIILLAWAIVLLVFNVIGGDGNANNGNNGNNNNGGNGFVPTFEIRAFTTSCEDPPDYQNKVYLCSGVAVTFNHWVDASTVEEGVESNTLKVEKCGDGSEPDDCKTPLTLLEPQFYSGNRPTGENFEWTANTNAIAFYHLQELFEAEKVYKVTIPKSIKDTSGHGISYCKKADGSRVPGCVETDTTFYWTFETGTETDDIPPEITSTYPISDPENPNYPDRNVNLFPTIWANFSEAIDPSTVNKDNINLYKLVEVNPETGEGGRREGEIPDDQYEVTMKHSGTGFDFQLIPPNLLESFIWYEVEVKDIKDLCWNNMEPSPFTWRFQTNDRVPGVSFYYPPNGFQFSCPDTEVFVQFNTSMYDSKTGSCGIHPDSGGYVTYGSLTPLGHGRNLRVVDDYPGSGNPNDYCKKYEFYPSDNSLNTNTDYEAIVNTRLIIDQEGNTLQGIWSFRVTEPESCANSPEISRVNPNRGPQGQCVTVMGNYFGEGTHSEDKVTFGGLEGDVDPEGWYNDYIVTFVPSGLDPGFHSVQVTAYHDPPIGPLSSNDNITFEVTDDPAFEGPCIYYIRPDRGPEGQDVDIIGTRFGGDDPLYNKVTFTPDISAGYTSWTEDKIDSSVPVDAVDGLVNVTNVRGTSNGVLFDVIDGGTGDECDGDPAPGCQDSGICAPGWFCDIYGDCTCHLGGGPGDPCDSNPETPECDPDNNLCRSEYVCKQDTCVCEEEGGGPGDPCDSNPETPECDPYNNLCSSGYVCKQDTCVCEEGPGPGDPCDSNPDTPECDPGICAPGLACDETDCICVPAGPGDPCQNENQCPGDLTICQGHPDYECLAGTEDCRCCCEPLEVNPQGLTCIADQDGCSGPDRGLYCGCERDDECGFPNRIGCGDLLELACCYDRPLISSKAPNINNTNCDRTPDVPDCQPNSDLCEEGVFCNPDDCRCNEVCSNVQVEVGFTRSMDVDSVRNNFFVSYADDPNNRIPGDVYAQFGNKIFIFIPQGGLFPESVDLRAVVVGDPNPNDANRPGVLTTEGVSMVRDLNYDSDSTPGNDSYSWAFKTLEGICQINKVEVKITPPGNEKYSDLFTCGGDDCSDDQRTNPGNQHIYLAQARDANGTPLMADYVWTDTNYPDDILKIENPSYAQALITAKNQNGSEEARVQVDGSNYGGSGIKYATVRTRAFLCENPWFYPDSSFNFDLFYCMDGGLPDLPMSVNYGSPTPGDGIDDLIQEYFFVEGGSGDAIGIRVMENEYRRSPSNWYQNQFPEGQGSPSSTQVDGYEAVREGRTIYVAGTNLSRDTLYTNIYLISYNEGAGSNIVNIYNQMVNNWFFNTNLSTYDKANIIDDTRRIADLVDIATLLKDYYKENGKYPTLEAGTYLEHFSTSRWPSWQATLGNELGSGLPVDPDNSLLCPFCWESDSVYGSREYSGLDIDKGYSSEYQGSIYGVSPSANHVQRCDTNFNNCETIMSGIFSDAEGLGLDKTNGEILVAKNSLIIRIDKNTPSSVLDQLTFESSKDVTTDQAGNVFFVAGSKVYKYDAGLDNELGQYDFSSDPDYDPSNPPWGVGVDKSNNVYVAAYGTNKVFKLNNDLTAILDTYGTGIRSPEYTHGPLGLDIDDKGRVYVVENLGHRAFVLDSEMENKLATFGVYDEAGSDNSHLNNPYRIREYGGYVYIVDRGNSRVVKLKQDLESDRCKTCWDEVNKVYHCPDGSHIYLYKGTAWGTLAEMYANLEYLGRGSWCSQGLPDCSKLSDPCGSVVGSDCHSFNYVISSGNAWDPRNKYTPS